RSRCLAPHSAQESRSRASWWCVVQRPVVVEEAQRRLPFPYQFLLARFCRQDVRIAREVFLPRLEILLEPVEDPRHLELTLAQPVARAVREKAPRLLLELRLQPCR